MDYLLCGNLPYPAWKKHISVQNLSNRRIRRYLVCRLKRPEARDFSHVRFTTKNQITGIFEVGKGTVNCSLISAREILIRMLLAGAVSFILCHNHPSGDTNPSQEDIQITESIGKAGSLIGVSLLDHLIIGEKNYTSLREIQAVTFE